MWKGKVRQRNIQLPDTSFTPYVYDIPTQTVRFGDMQARFRPQGIELLNGATLRATIQIHPETFSAGQWRRQITTRNPLQVVNVSRNESRDYFHATLTSGTSDLSVIVRFRVGGSNKIEWQTTIKATNAGRHRAILDFTGLTEVPQPITRFQPGSRRTVTLPAVKYKLGGLIHAWRPSEEADHMIEGDATMTSIGLGEGTYTKGQEKIITPDTTGEASIAVEGDDGDELVDATWSDQGNAGDGNLYVDDDTAGNSNLAIGVGWRAIDLNTTSPGVDSIDAGTFVHCFNGGVNQNPGNIECTLRGDDSSGAVWSSTNKPSTVTSTTANVTVTPTTGDQTLACEGIVSEWVVTDGLTYEGATGEDMYLYLINVTAGAQDFWSGCQDYDGAGAGEETGLTIVYTPSAAGRIMSSLANDGGLAGKGGMAGFGGGLAG